jgi:phospholipid-binding lipoprotein MlaA
MRLILASVFVASSLLLSGCVSKGTNPDDPFERINRKTHAFNMVFDTYVLKPPSKVYKKVVPSFVRAGVNNAYNNVNMLPTVANDLLQAEWNYAIKDTWRFIANSTIGVAGVIDVAQTFSLPPHSNDLGLTFAKWGDKKSPYVVIPLLGPSTIRDGMGMIFDYTLFTPYPYIRSNAVLYSLLGLRYIDIRSQMLETDRLIAESLDKYAFIRDAYLQHRNFLITGEQQDNGDLYVGDEDDDSVLSSTPDKTSSPLKFPLTTSSKHVAHSPVSA